MKSVFVFLMLLIIQPAHSGCDWTKNKNKYTMAARIKGAIRTLERCKEECEKDRFCDQGIDYSPAAKQCYFSGHDYLSNYDGIDHYFCLRPGGYVPYRGCIWTEHKDKKTAGAERKEAFRTLDRCTEECGKDPHCDKGIDYFAAAKQCYFSRSGVLTNYVGIDHHFCSKPVENLPSKGCVWTKHKDKHMPVGDKQTAFRTLERCKEGCEKDPHCDKGIDYWDAAKQCYFSRSGVLTNYGGIDHYSCSKNCKWRISPGMRASGKPVEIHDNPFWDCARRCVIAPPEICASIDYISPLNNQRETCYLHGKDNIYSVLTHQSSVRFAKDCGCLWRYKGKSGKNYHYLKSSPKTLETCKGACLEDLQCQTGIHWDHKNEECYFGADFTANFDNWSISYVHEEFDHYLCEF